MSSVLLVVKFSTDADFQIGLFWSSGSDELNQGSTMSHLQGLSVANYGIMSYKSYIVYPRVITSVFGDFHLWFHLAVTLLKKESAVIHEVPSIHITQLAFYTFQSGIALFIYLAVHPFVVWVQKQIVASCTCCKDERKCKHPVKCNVKAGPSFLSPFSIPAVS